MKKQAIVYTILAGALIGGIQSCAPAEEEKIEVAQKPMVDVALVKDTSFTHRIRVQGNVETDQDILLTAEMGGLITKVNVKSGDRVAAGQTLVVLDAALINSGAQEIETQLEYAEYMFQKQEELIKNN